MKFGPTFYDELKAAGLAGLPFSWGEDGVYVTDAITPEQKAAIEAVIAAHDPMAIGPDRKKPIRDAVTGANSLVELKQVILDYLV